MLLKMSFTAERHPSYVHSFRRLRVHLSFCDCSADVIVVVSAGYVQQVWAHIEGLAHGLMGERGACEFFSEFREQLEFEE